MSDNLKILRSVSRSGTDKGAPDFIFFCPGCQCGHGVWVSREAGNGAKWSFNGNMEKPTFQPSLKIEASRFTAKGKADYEAWAAAGYPSRNGKPFESAPVICHTFVTDGVIHFLPDCTHELAGKKVPMVPF